MSNELLRKYIDIINEAHIREHIQISKAQANYTDHAMGEFECHQCEHFQAPHQCEIVLGFIEPEGWCKYFQSEMIEEKWGKATVVSPSEKGKYAGKSKSELLKTYNALKKSGPHHKGTPEFERMRELAFAIRSKGNWGKVQD